MYSNNSENEERQRLIEPRNIQENVVIISFANEKKKIYVCLNKMLSIVCFHVIII